MTSTPHTTAATTAGVDIATTRRHLVASVILVDPHPADRRPRVLLMWSTGYGAWVFPTAHLRTDESLPETALRAATTVGIDDARLLRPTPLQPVPGLSVADSPWRSYTIGAPPARHTNPGSGLPWHQHIDHLFIALADPTTTPTPVGLFWYPIDTALDTRPDIPTLAAAAAHEAATTTTYQPHPCNDRQPGHQPCPQDHRGRVHR